MGCKDVEILKLCACWLTAELKEVLIVIFGSKFITLSEEKREKLRFCGRSFGDGERLLGVHLLNLLRSSLQNV